MARPRVLVVEDDNVVADLVARIASHEGFLTRSSNSMNAASQCHEFRPDLIVLDIFMPELDGFEVLQYLATHHLPVSVIILSSTNSSYRKMAERMGEELGLSIIANVAKPFTIGQLQEVFDHFKKIHTARLATAGFERKWFVNNN